MMTTLIICSAAVAVIGIIVAVSSIYSDLKQKSDEAKAKK